MASAEQAAYLKEAASWDTELHRKERSAKRLWQALFFVMVAIVAMLSLALMALTPLKEVRPWVIPVDSETGRTVALHTVQSGPLTEEEAVVKALVGRYVIARETYDIYDGQERYNQVFGLSLDQARKSYVETWDSRNPQNPLLIYGEKTRMTVEIFSISMLNERTANVRFYKTVTAPGGHEATAEYSGIVGFTFQRRDADLARIIANPLGFVVTSYRVDEVYKGEG